MNISERFLRAKHWQLFIILFGVPLVLQIFVMIEMFRSLVNLDQPDPRLIFNYFRFFPVIGLLFGGVLFGWLWSIGVGLQSRLPVNVHMNVKRFKIFFFIPVVYSIFFAMMISTFISNLLPMTDHSTPDPAIVFPITGLIVPLHLFCMFCIFYCLYFVAKTLKTAELQRETTFSDFAGEIFLIWFYFIGVWIIQPKVNKMVEDTAERSA